MLNLTGSYQYPSSCGVKVALEHLEASSSDRNWDSPKKEPCGRGWRMEEVQSQLGISFDGEGHGGGVLSRFSPASTLQSPSSVSHWLNGVRGNWQIYVHVLWKGNIKMDLEVQEIYWENTQERQREGVAEKAFRPSAEMQPVKGEEKIKALGTKGLRLS